VKRGEEFKKKEERQIANLRKFKIRRPALDGSEN